MSPPALAATPAPERMALGGPLARLFTQGVTQEQKRGFGCSAKYLCEIIGALGARHSVSRKLSIHKQLPDVFDFFDLNGEGKRPTRRPTFDGHARISDAAKRLLAVRAARAAGVFQAR